MTLYAEVNGSTLIAYPYTLALMSSENNNTAYPTNTDFVTLFPSTDHAKSTGNTLVAVVQAAQPTYDPTTQSCTLNASPTQIAGVWTLGWTVAPLTAATVAQTVTQGQFMQACAQLGIGGTTAAQVLAFAQNGTLPSWMATAIGTLPANQQAIFQARMIIDANYTLASPVMQGLAAAAGITQAQLVAVFGLAATL